MSGAPKGSIINFPIKDIVTLNASYMSFIQGGGLFIPSPRQVTMGEEVFVLVNLPESSERVPLSGEVIWISKSAVSGKSPGFGIRLSGPEGVKFKSDVEAMLAGKLNGDHPTFTM